MTNPVPSAPVPSNVPAVQPAAPALSEAAVLMLSQIKMLDPNKQAVGLDKLRPFYPRIGWNIIGATVKELEDAGKLKARNVMSPKGTVAYKVYTWQEG